MCFLRLTAHIINKRCTIELIGSPAAFAPLEASLRIHKTGTTRVQKCGKPSAYALGSGHSRARWGFFSPSKRARASRQRPPLPSRGWSSFVLGADSQGRGARRAPCPPRPGAPPLRCVPAARLLGLHPRALAPHCAQGPPSAAAYCCLSRSATSPAPDSLTAPDPPLPLPSTASLPLTAPHGLVNPTATTPQPREENQRIGTQRRRPTQESAWLRTATARFGDWW